MLVTFGIEFALMFGKMNKPTNTGGCKMDKPRIESIKIKHMVDEYPDTSFIGDFSDTPKDGAINHKERSGENRVYEWFNPGSDPEYAEQDYKRIMELENGHFSFIGIHAEATVSYSTGGDNRRLEWFTSSGLWGIESDSDQAYLEEIENEEISNLKNHLEQFNVDVSSFDEIEIERDD